MGKCEVVFQVIEFTKQLPRVIELSCVYDQRILFFTSSFQKYVIFMYQKTLNQPTYNT